MLKPRLVAFITISTFGVIPHSITSISLYLFLSSKAFSLVLLLIMILETPKFFKAIIKDETTPPAPKINTFLSVVLNFEYLIASSKPAISVLCPTMSLFSR